MSEFRMGSRMCNYCRRDLPSPDLCGCDGEKRARVKSMEAEIEKARANIECRICWGSGKVAAFRGPTDKIKCIHCSGTGLSDRAALGTQP